MAERIATVNKREPRSRRPTPIPIAWRTFVILLVVGLIVLVLGLRAAPSVLVILLGGSALALLLSFPVRWLSEIMSRRLAIAVTLVGVVGLILLALALLVPLVIDQLAALVGALPGLAARADDIIRSIITSLDQQEWLPTDPQQVIARLGQEVFTRAQALAQDLLTGLLSSITSAFNLAVQLFGIVFVAIYLLADIRTFKAAYLRLAPHRYRRDADALWNNFSESLRHYLGGLVFIMALQGALSAAALWLLDVPYALLLGLWVSITAIIPYLGAWLGAIPAVVLALFESPTTAILTALLFLGIQQLEGNVLTPRIQGQTLHVHPILVLLAVTAGGEIGGLLGVIFAVPTLAVLRVLFDFFRKRLRIQPTHAMERQHNAERPVRHLPTIVRK